MIICEHLPDKKKYSTSNENMFFLRKTYETICNPPFLRESPPLFQLPTYFWAMFSWPSCLSKFQKRDIPPLIFLGGGNYIYIYTGHGTSNHFSRQTRRLYVHNPKETFVVLWASTVNSKFSYSFCFSVYVKFFYSSSPSLPDVIKFPKESSPDFASNIK